MTIKPWTMDLALSKLAEVKECSPMAVAMDIDAAGLVYLKSKRYLLRINRFLI